MHGVARVAAGIINDSTSREKLPVYIYIQCSGCVCGCAHAAAIEAAEGSEANAGDARLRTIASLNWDTIRAARGRRVPICGSYCCVW